MGEKNRACRFCDIINDEKEADIVFSDDSTIAFLDKRPVFHGHCLIIPKEHVETVMDAPESLLERVMDNIKLLSIAVKNATECDGILIINNNVISQSVPHLHFHVIPRRNGELLAGFMRPRHPYKNRDEAEEARDRIRDAVKELKKG